MAIIAPSFLSANFLNLQADCKMIDESEADWFHLDVMDGRFVPNITFGFPLLAAMKRAAKKKLPLPKRAAAILARLKNVRGLSDDEKSVHALGLAATPQERWDLSENCVRSAGFWRPLKKKA